MYKNTAKDTLWHLSEDREMKLTHGSSILQRLICKLHKLYANALDEFWFSDWKMKEALVIIDAASWSRMPEWQSPSVCSSIL